MGPTRWEEEDFTFATTKSKLTRLLLGNLGGDEQARFCNGFATGLQHLEQVRFLNTAKDASSSGNKMTEGADDALLIRVWGADDPLLIRVWAASRLRRAMLTNEIPVWAGGFGRLEYNTTVYKLNYYGVYTHQLSLSLTVQEYSYKGINTRRHD